MTKTIEFIEKEIKNIKELFELDDALCLKTDEDYKFWYNRLQTLKQIKCELETWEIIKSSINLSENCEDYKNRAYLNVINYSDKEWLILKKTLEVDNNEQRR